MRTIQDDIIEWSKDKWGFTTNIACERLGLDKTNYFSSKAANYFNHSLFIISEQQEQLKSLQDALENLICCSAFNGQVFENDKETHKAWTIARYELEKIKGFTK